MHVYESYHVLMKKPMGMNKNSRSNGLLSSLIIGEDDDIGIDEMSHFLGILLKFVREFLKKKLQRIRNRRFFHSIR